MLLYLFCNKSHYENVPFEIPESWCWCTLSELCIFLSRGKSPKYSEERLFPVFAQKCNLKDGGISLDQARFLDPSTIGKWGDDYKLKSGDVLVNSTGTGTVGRTRLFDECCLGEYPFVVPDSHVSVVRTVTEIDSFYICAILSSNWGQLYLEDNLAGSTNQKELYIGVLEDMFIPLPPKNEQKKIAKEITRWEKYVDNIDVVKAELSNHVKQTKSKILDLAISGKLVPQGPNDEPAIELLKRINPGFKPCDNSHYENLPQGWELVSLNSIVDIISGVSYAKSDIKENGVRILRGGNIQDGEIICLEDDVFIDQSYSNIVNSVVKGDIVLVASTGSPTLIGKTGYARITYPDTQIGAFLRIIRPKTSEISAYLNLIFNSDFYKNYIRSLAKGTNINNVKNGYIEQLEVALPPIQEQERIVKMVENIFISLDNITAGLL